MPASLGSGRWNYREPITTIRKVFAVPSHPSACSLRIVKTLLHTGSVDFAGHYYQAIPVSSAAGHVPVMAAALGEKATNYVAPRPDGAN